MGRFRAAGLYLVTGEGVSAGRSTYEIVAQALSAGVRLVQLREKEKSTRELFALACALRELCDRYGALLLIDDHVDVALASRADGVHLGDEDLPPRAARELFPDGIIGVSTHDRAQALAAQNSGASYYNIGPVFPTTTKRWSGAFLGPGAIPEISAGCPLPFTVMGGIKRDNIEPVLAAGARTVAVVTAVTAAADPAAECVWLLDRVRRAR
jgi:thiamine-phosphate pyrophosphorylase